MSPAPLDASARGYVVVGVSPTTGSRAALRRAAEEARLRGFDLRAITAWSPPVPSGPPGIRPPAIEPRTPEEWQAEVEEGLTAAVRQALGDASDVTCLAVRGATSKVLLAAAEGAQMLVLGPPHLHGSEALLARVRPLRLISTARCPVLIVPARGADAS
ncbi:MAG: universal stress protein [Candidatus Dormibacteria bacterium]